MLSIATDLKVTQVPETLDAKGDGHPFGNIVTPYETSGTIFPLY